MSVRVVNVAISTLPRWLGPKEAELRVQQVLPPGGGPE